MNSKLEASRLRRVRDSSYLTRCSWENTTSDVIMTYHIYIATESLVFLDLFIWSFVIFTIIWTEANKASCCICNWICNVISILWFFLILDLEIISSRWQPSQWPNVLRLLLWPSWSTYRSTCDIRSTCLILWPCKRQSTISIAAFISIALFLIATFST